jgi:hypothetical protein
MTIAISQSQLYPDDTRLNPIKCHSFIFFGWLNCIKQIRHFDCQNGGFLKPESPVRETSVHSVAYRIQ